MNVYMELVKQPFQLLRRLLAISIIAVSIPLAIYVAVTVAEILTSRSASVRYNKVLVEFYLKAKDWEFIHFLERTINTSDLDGTYLDLYDKQVWSNYMQDPQEYWFIGREKDDPLTGFFRKREGDFRAFILKRSDYLTKDPTPFIYRKIGSTQALAQLNQLLYDIETQARTSRESLREGRNTEALLALQRLQQNSDRYSATVKFDQDSSRYSRFEDSDSQGNFLPYVILSPKYKPVVYDSFLRLYVVLMSDVAEADPLIFETSQEILFNRNEDPLLKLLAIDYVARVLAKTTRAQPEVTEKLFKVLDDARKTGKFIDSGLSENSDAERVFQQQMFTIFKKLVELQAEKPINR